MGNTPHWISYDGDIQTTLGGPVLGSLTSGAHDYNDGAGSTIYNAERSYSIQVDIQPISACAPLPAAATSKQHT